MISRSRQLSAQEMQTHVQENITLISVDNGANDRLTVSSISPKAHRYDPVAVGTSRDSPIYVSPGKSFHVMTGGF